MADNRPIGVFDSGVGGLTVLHALHEQCPRESTIYLGDLARFPYGTRPQAEVRRFARQVGDFLATEGIKLLVIACNTATAAAERELRVGYTFPVVGVIEPGARQATLVSVKQRVGVVATDGTVASGAYRSAIVEQHPDTFVVERSASWLVPLIERGPLARGRVTAGLAPMLADMRAVDIDVLILGCTHFPLVRDIFEAEIGPEIAVLDSATTTAGEVERRLRDLGMEADGPPQHRLLVTGPAEAFAERAQAMFRTSRCIETVDLVLDAVL